MLKFRLYFFLLVATLFIGFTSCKTTKESTSKIETLKPLEKALLWKVEGNGLKTPSYVYGTIHIIDKSDYFLPNGTLAAIDESAKMVFEIDMKDMNDLGKMMGIMNQAFMKDNKTLKDLYTPEEYKIVDNFFSDMGLPMFMLERMKPMFLTVFAYGDMDPQGLQSGSLKSYEMEFYEIAENANKTTAGLETIEFQMSMFDSIPYENQAQMLLETIQSNDTSGDEFAEMTALYKSQNIEGMISMISEDSDGIGEFEDMLVAGRNKNWIPLMNEMMAKEPIFFAVGAGHLAGKFGVLNLLKKEGYTITPVSQIQ